MSAYNDENVDSFDEDTPPEESNSRTFLLIAGGLGLLLLLAFFCLGGYFLFSNNAMQQAEATSIAQVTWQAATIQAAVTQTANAVKFAETPNPLTATVAMAMMTSTDFLPAMNGDAEMTQLAVNTTPTPVEASTVPANQTPGFASPTAGQPISSLQDELFKVDNELSKSVQGNFSYTAPAKMQLDERFTIQLILSPSLAVGELETQIAQESGLATSTSIPGELVTESGGIVNVISDRIDITSQMKAVLRSEDPEAFDIQALHDSDIQDIGTLVPTEWNWIIKAKKNGDQRLLVIIYRLVKVNDRESWREIETYEANINVEVSWPQKIRSWDWKYIVTTLVALLALIISFRNRNNP